MSLAVVAMMVAAASCGNNASKKAAAEAEAAQADSTCCGEKFHASFVHKSGPYRQPHAGK